MRYFFDVHDGFSNLDNTGVELRGHEEAKLEAIRFFGSFIDEHADKITRSGDDWSVTVINEDGTTVCRLLLLVQAVASLPAWSPSRMVARAG